MTENKKVKYNYEEKIGIIVKEFNILDYLIKILFSGFVNTDTRIVAIVTQRQRLFFNDRIILIKEFIKLKVKDKKYQQKYLSILKDIEKNNFDRNDVIHSLWFESDLFPNTAFSFKNYHLRKPNQNAEVSMYDDKRFEKLINNIHQFSNETIDMIDELKGYDFFYIGGKKKKRRSTKRQTYYLNSRMEMNVGDKFYKMLKGKLKENETK